MEKTFDSIENENRDYEGKFDVRVKAPYVIVRLDGKGFSKFTKECYAKPFDYIFMNQMVATAEYIMNESGYDVIAAYTQSDEISLIIKGDEMPYQAKTRKLLSILASMAGAKFTQLSGHIAVFDARYRTAETKEELKQYIHWRSSDSTRNCLNNYCYWGLLKHGYGVKQVNRMLKGLSSDERKVLLSIKVYKEWDSIPKVEKNGVFLNYVSVAGVGHNPITNEDVETTRRVIKRNSDKHDFEKIIDEI